MCCCHYWKGIAVDDLAPLLATIMVGVCTLGRGHRACGVAEVDAALGAIRGSVYCYVSSVYQKQCT